MRKVTVIMIVLVTVLAAQFVNENERLIASYKQKMTELQEEAEKMNEEIRTLQTQIKQRQDYLLRLQGRFDIYAELLATAQADTVETEDE